MDQIHSNIEHIQERIKNAAARSGRKDEDITLMAVTKTKPREDVERAYHAGIRVFGENRVFEARDKYEGFYSDAELHLIGHLQSNKAKTAAEIFSWIQSIDKFKTAREVQKKLETGNKKINILLEVNTSGEKSKSGYPSEEALLEEIENIISLKNLRLRGLMTIAPFTSDEAAIRKSFRNLYGIMERLKSRFPELKLDTLSMGMSGDFEIAVEEGATLVRVGSLIFGERHYS